MIIESNTPRTDAAILTGSNRLDQGEYVEASFAQTLERELAQALIPPTDPAIEPSDLVSAGDAMVKALAAAQAQIECGCGQYGPCRRCTATSIEAAASAEAWEEAKNDASKATL